MVVAIHKAKTCFRAARAQAVFIDNHSVAWLVALWLKTAGPRERLVPGGYAELTHCFKVLLRAAKASSLPLTVASLRGGGAVADMLKGRKDLARIMMHGRWDAIKTLNHYLQEGMALLTRCRLSLSVQALHAQLAVLLPSLLPAS